VATKYTTLVRNEALGTSRFVGTFDDQVTAQAYADAEAAHSRKFATWEIWTGTPKTPIKPLIGTLVRGKH